VVSQFYAAGHAMCMVELLRHPPAMQKAQEELEDVIGRGRVAEKSDIPQFKYLDQAVVKETFRLHPAAPLLLAHETIADCAVGGYIIAAKTRIFVNAWDVHRHPCAYANPLEFNPSRFLNVGH